MGCPVPTCAECAQKCWLTHGKEWGKSSIVTSFFKIMMSGDFSHMRLPPAFVRFVPELKDQKGGRIEKSLEDSSGKRWKVTLSKSNGVWAFWQGWHAFSLDQGLKVGDFLTFHYIKGSGLFVVQIFGRHGLEKNKHTKVNGRGTKRARSSSSNFVAENSEKPSSGSDSRKRQASDTSALSGSNAEPIISEQVVADKNSDTTGGVGREAQVPETRCEEELVYMVNRDKGYEQEGDRITFYDLSNFETPRSKDVDGDRISGNKGSSFVSSIPPKSHAMNVGVSKLIEKECFTASTSSRQPTSDSISSQEKTNKKLTNKDQSSKLVKKATPMGLSNKGAQWKFAAVPKFTSEESIKTQNYGFDGKLKKVKQEQMEIKEESFRSAKIMNGKGPVIKEGNQSCSAAVKDHLHPLNAVVKPEPMDMDEEEEYRGHDFATTDSGNKAFNWSVTLVVATHDYLESRVRFPSTSVRGRPRVQRLLLLRDPASRLWPVMYCERLGRHVLISGWSGFCKCNNVREGDECVFKVEDRFEGIYGVSIIRK